MKHQFFKSLIFSIVMIPSFALGHGGESRVEIELETPSRISAGNVTVEFQLFDNKENKVVTESDLNLSHEKKLHFITYDPGLKEFQHVHPEFDGNVWRADLSYTVDGKYFIWAQGELAVDGEEFSALERIEVSGGNSAWPAPPKLSDVRVGADGISIATLSNQQLKAGQMAMLDLTFSHADGTTPSVTPYLGAFAHVIVTPEDGDSLIHVHPMNGATPYQGMLHVMFPDKGYYRLWVQYIDASQIKTIPLSVQVF